MYGIYSDTKCIFVTYFYSALLFTFSLAADCEKSKCLGPLRFYEDLRCTPIYKSAGDCCAIRYDCSNLFKRSFDMCYANGTAYAIGENLQNKDRLNPCKIGCYCQKNDEVAKFTCSEIDCFFSQTKPECYVKRKFDNCCSEEEVCPKDSKNRTKCEVDGKTYFEGEIFYPKSKTRIVCQCMDGYKGKNELPYCKEVTCGVEEHYPSKIYKKCAPLYSTTAFPHVSCTNQFRCQQANDTIINKVEKISDENNEMLCEFGNMTLRIGEELNQSNSFTSTCVKCKCEVPPTLTCQRLTAEVCKIKFH